MRLQLLEQIAERVTGKTADDLRQTSVERLREQVELRHGGKPMQFPSHFPFIGRGNVMRDRTISHVDVEKVLDRILR